MTARTDLARRLELSEVKEVGDLVTGRARGLTVTLQGEAPFTGCVVELGAAVPIARLVMRPGDLNHPDAVETGDSAFDERMQVMALAGLAPTLQKLLADAALRRAMIDFFQRHPGAEFNGSRLHVPGGEGGVTQALVVDALTVAETVAERFAEVGFLESEAAPSLPPSRPRGALWRALVGSVSLTGLSYLLVANLLDLKADAVGVGLGVLSLAMGLATGAIAARPEEK